MHRQDGTQLIWNFWQFSIAIKNATYTAGSHDVIKIQYDCSRLRNFQLQEITQMYNYTVSHVKGIKNHLADVLSYRPVWLAPDNSLGSDQGLDLDEGDDFAMRVLESKPQLLMP